MHDISIVSFQRARTGRLNWGFQLTQEARAYLGPLVTVSIPYAALNGRPILSPYSPHFRWSGYDFHGSLNDVNFVGGGRDTIVVGDRLSLLWFIRSLNGRYAHRFITCRIPHLPPA